MSKFKTVAPGIRKKPDGTFIATKSIKGKRHYHVANTLTAAKNWKNLFVPFVNPNAKSEAINPAVTFKMNGKDFETTFGKCWERYQQEHLSTLAGETQYRMQLRLSKFSASITNVRMCEINEETIDAIIQERKILTQLNKRGYQRCHFNIELKMLRQVFDWYSLNMDPYFESPIKPFHKRIGKIKSVPKVEKHMKPDEVVLLTKHLSGIWHKLACLQFYMAGRVQEPAGLLKTSIDRVRRRIRIQHVMTWIKGRPVLKETTKTDVVTYVAINDHMMRMIDELEAESPPDCPYLFQINGKPLRYSRISQEYKKALKSAQLPYTGTHILRYAMAGYGGEILGDEGSKAVTRHGSMAMARHYRGKAKEIELTEENRHIVIHAEGMFRATNCDQDEVSECI